MPHSTFTARIRFLVMARYRRFPVPGQADAQASILIAAR
jgi:hypothetical protein